MGQVRADITREMGQAIQDFMRLVRDDPRNIDGMKPGSDRRAKLVNDHIEYAAKLNKVDANDLRVEIIRYQEGNEMAERAAAHFREGRERAELREEVLGTGLKL